MRTWRSWAPSAVDNVHIVIGAVVVLWWSLVLDWRAILHFPFCIMQSRSKKDAKWLLFGVPVWSTGQSTARVGAVSPSILAKRRALPRCVQRVSDDSTVVHISTSRSSPRQHEGQAAVHGAQPRPPPIASPHFHGLIGRSISPWRCSTCRRERDGAPNKSNSTIRPNLSFETLPPRESGVKPNPTSPLNSGTACPKSRPHIVPCENSTGGTTLDPRRSPLSPLCTRLILSALQDGVVQIFAIFEG